MKCECGTDIEMFDSDNEWCPKCKIYKPFGWFKNNCKQPEEEVLKPCPFCGEIPQEGKLSMVACMKAKCRMYAIHFDKTKWNTRTGEPNE